MNISVVGLGRLGAPLAAWISSKGHKVVGIDIDPATIDAIFRGNAPVQEPGLQEMMEVAPFRATMDLQGAVLDTDITFIIVPTPSEENGAFSLKHVTGAAQNIALALKQKEDYHLVVIVSTVMPGHTDQIAGLLERMSGKVCGVDFGLCYNPEFIALGSVLHDLEDPDFVLIGESDEGAGSILEDFYKAALTKTRWLADSYAVQYPIIRRMNFVNAEIAKLSLNCYVTMKISYANTLGAICEQFPGGDVDTVTAAIGNDSRIGWKYLKAGVGWGGPCFPRDNRALRAAVKGQYMLLPLPHASVLENDYAYKHISDTVRRWLTPDMTLGVLGLAYKPGTSVTEESQGMALYDDYINQAIAYDPLVGILTLDHVLETADVLVVMLPLDEFKDLSRAKAKVIIDPWRCVQKTQKNCRYLPLGRYHK